ncbi:MAG: tRNA 2-selenouridine(34) synthase MnmH [gamma proteobacterium symbiont of Taylorina sp.]|nr:tRNA 2-selenouridine(34) synthase MnmH [gamma proteobacterium symbiont of Taylorina sp.]
MSNPIDRNLIRSLFLNNIPLLDVRAPVEFLQGAFPHAVNYPLMNDQERHDIGIRYKRNGQDAAIKLGNKLVSGEIKQNRIEQWKDFIKQSPNAYLYCFRGGLRSRTVQQWLQENGINIPLINGGYRAMRRVLLDELEEAIASSHFVVLGGKTGTGKTWLLKELSQSIDLERLAHHRGSSFGRFPDGQPSQINFENTLSILLMKYRNRNMSRFWLEDESRLIGSRVLPQSLQDKMKQAPLVMLEEDISYRIGVTLKDYVIDLEAYYINYCSHLYSDESVDPFAMFADYLLSSLDRIQKRLGGERYQKIRLLMTAALNDHKATKLVDSHRQWIELLLTSYYDPMYEYQLEKKQNQIIFRGNFHQILASQNALINQ